MSTAKKYFPSPIFFLIIILAFIFRLSLTNLAMHDDIVVQAGWGKWIYQNQKMFGFYENNIWIYGWPNQPPLISFLYGFSFTIHEWLNTFLVGIGNFIALNHLGASHLSWFYKFVIWFFAEKFSDTPFAIGQLISLKLIPIIGDLLLAGLVYLTTKRLSDTKKAQVITIIYLFSPFSWYESAIWGQHDQIGFIFLFLAFLTLMSQKWRIWAPMLFIVSIGLKVTGLIFTPLFLWLMVRSKREFVSACLGAMLSIFIYFILVRLISPNNFVQFNLNLQKQMFAKGDWATWVNTFNFWRLITIFQTDSRTIFWGLSYQIWGYVVYGCFYIYALFISRNRDLWSVIRALFIVAFSGWLFMTTMHERYLVAAVMFGLILSVKYSRLFKYWSILSLIFWVNLYAAWWKPEIFWWLKNILLWQKNDLIPKLLSLVLIGLFIRMTKLIRFRKNSGKIVQQNPPPRTPLPITGS